MAEKDIVAQGAQIEADASKKIGEMAAQFGVPKKEAIEEGVAAIGIKDAMDQAEASGEGFDLAGFAKMKSQQADAISQKQAALVQTKLTGQPVNSGQAVGMALAQILPILAGAAISGKKGGLAGLRAGGLGASVMAEGIGKERATEQKKIDDLASVLGKQSRSIQKEADDILLEDMKDQRDFQQSKDLVRFKGQVDPSVGKNGISGLVSSDVKGVMRAVKGAGRMLEGIKNDFRKFDDQSFAEFKINRNTPNTEENRLMDRLKVSARTLAKITDQRLTNEDVEAYVESLMNQFSSVDDILERIEGITSDALNAAKGQLDTDVALSRAQTEEELYRILDIGEENKPEPTIKIPRLVDRKKVTLKTGQEVKVNIYEYQAYKDEGLLKE